ncbi:MAG TPA: DUF2169 domain-containing protein [Bryobacteraceae bacterium]|nr:DUF2169 domain-containing protein [Bryobacteraceae bacterium]
MDFVNTTPACAAFLNTTFGENHMQAAVIARLAFRVEGGRLLPTPESKWPVGPAPAQTPWGDLPGDVPFLTGGIDVLVMGSLWQPGGQPGTELTAEILIGERFLRRITAIGDRRWIWQNGSLVPETPQPFVSMPLTYDRAFGGDVETENGFCSWPPNPAGKGFYVTPEQAEGQPLPNLEDPEHRIASIEDRPEPMATGPYPAEGSLRVEQAVELDLESDNPGLKRIRPLVFNCAHPRMILTPSDTPRHGEIVEITHASPQGALQFQMPECEFHAQVSLENRSYAFPLHLDQIAVLLEEQRVILGYRVVFKYRLVKGERRCVTLREGAVPEGEGGSSHGE